MEVLRELASEECLRRSGLGVVRIAVRLGREKSQVSRALRALEAEGLVERDPRTRTYQLGPGLYTLTARGVEARLVLAASGHLYRLADQQRADVRLCVLIGNQVLTLLAMPPVSDTDAQSLTRSPSGGVLTLDWPEAAVAGLAPVGTPEHHDLLAGWSQVRARGYLHVPASDIDPARWAAPVRDVRGVVLAAIQLSPRPGEDPEVPATAPGEAVVHAADALSVDCGYPG